MHCSKCVSFWGTSYSRPPIDPYLTSPLLQNPGGATGWRRGVLVSGVRRMNKVNARRARLVLGRVTVFGRVCYIGM